MHNISSGGEWTGAVEDGVTYTADGEGGRKGDKRREGKLCSIGYVVFIGEREGDAHVVARKRMKAIHMSA